MTLTKDYSNNLFLHLYYRFRGLAKRPEMDRELVVILNTNDTTVTPENLHEYLAITLRCSRDKGKDIVKAYYSARGTLRELEKLIQSAYNQGKEDGTKWTLVTDSHVGNGNPPPGEYMRVHRTQSTTS